MQPDRQPIGILVAEDDEEDRLLLRDAFSKAKLPNEIRFVEDGEYLLDYLLHRHGYSDAQRFPEPGLILLDLNMPRTDGREALKEIKSHAHLRQIPTVVLTTSRAEDDILHTYDLGVNSFIVKPKSFSGLVDVVHTLTHYWFDVVRLPGSRS